MHFRYRSGLILIITLLLILGYVLGHPFHHSKKQLDQKTGKQTQLKNPKVSETSLSLDGQKAPNFLLQTLTGKTQALKEFKGNTLLLVTWATWCKECHVELQSLQNETETDAPPFTIVLINMTSEEGSITDVKKYVATHQLTLPVLLDQKGAFEKSYRVQVIPTSILIDSYGNILHSFYGPVRVSTIKNWLPSA
jgi:peroxiredoxin